MSDKQRTWCNEAVRRGGSFVTRFAEACFAADDINFQLLAPVLDKLMAKYPKYSEVKA